MSRCSFLSAGKGWLVNLFLPINRLAPNYTKQDAVVFHERLQAIAVRLAWMLGPDDAIQFVSGEDATPRQFYKQWLKKNGRSLEISERQTIHEAQPVHFMGSASNRGPRPMGVKVAVALWGAGALLNLIVGATQTDWHDWVMYPTFAVLVALSLLLMWFIYLGKNWARWLLVGLVGFRLFMLLGRVHRMDGISGYDAASVGLRLVLQFGAMFLLFSRPAMNWFRGGQHAG